MDDALERLDDDLWVASRPLPIWVGDIGARMTVIRLETDRSIYHAGEQARLYAHVLDEDFEPQVQPSFEITVNGQGGDVWAQQVRDIYDPQRIETGLRTALSDGLEPDEIEAATAFYASQAGTEIVASENRARRLMSDAGIPSAARELVAQTRQENPALYAMVENYIGANGLIENNVAASMSQQHRFFLGLSDGGYTERTEADILDEVWQMRDPLTAETRDWLFGYLVLAYIGLPQDDLDAYLAFSRSEAGQALNAALFNGFGTVFRDVSYGLGRAVALHATRDAL